MHPARRVAAVGHARLRPHRHRNCEDLRYYSLVENDPRRYVNTTELGCSLQIGNPHVLQMITDSLRYWIDEMHVDGFRFDLAASLAPQPGAHDRPSAFFEVIQQDPLISQVKLIADPAASLADQWNPELRAVSRFPPLWAEQNRRYRDSVRDFWRPDAPVTALEFSHRLTGSRDLFVAYGTSPVHSINTVTSNDGFTLHDLVSYEDKHNEINGQDNLDGEPNNRSWNCGADDGPTDDPAVVSLRDRQKRNFLATLFLSQGVPLLLHGDELGRTQGGNNNAYCHDSTLPWIINWETAEQGLNEWVSELSKLRRKHPIFRRRRFVSGELSRGKRDPRRDVAWLTRGGREIPDEAMGAYTEKEIVMFLNGDAIWEPDPQGERVVDYSFLLIFNASEGQVSFAAPEPPYSGQWELVLDTLDAAVSLDSGDRSMVNWPLLRESHSLCVLQQRGDP